MYPANLLYLAGAQAELFVSRHCAGRAQSSTKIPIPYSCDLGWTIIWRHVFQKMMAEDVAKMICVSRKSVYRYSERFLITGDVRPFLKRSGPLRELCEQFLLVELVLSNPGIYLIELQEELYYTTMHWVDVSTICRTLQQIG